MEDVLKKSELAAVRAIKNSNPESSVINSANSSEIISHVVGKKPSKKKRGYGAAGFITVILLVLAFFFSAGNLIPGAISERLIEEMDVQYADAVESKILVFTEAMKEGDVPNNTALRLKENGVLVGQGTSGDFTEVNKASSPLSLLFKNQVISAADFSTKIHQDASLYDAFNKATYGRAAYYYDDAAKSVFQKLGTSRNNYNADSDFDEVMTKILGKGSNLNINNVGTFEREGEDGKKTTDYDTYGSTVSSTTSNLVEQVRSKSTADSELRATLNAADTLNTADTVANEQRSALLFLAFMENISKMKAGEGNQSKINEAMNYLYESRDTEVLDVKTGQPVTTSGSMVESPSLYAVLSGSSLDTTRVENYSNDRILKTIENRVGVDSAGSDTLLGTISSIGGKVKGIISRFLPSGSTPASETVNLVAPTVERSLVNNQFETIGGVSGGEMLVEGAVNVGKELAKASGGAAGDGNAALAYLKLSTDILALESEADRLNRSPFDITSKNTFLGSIAYRLAISTTTSNHLLSQVSTFSNLISSSIASMLPQTYADNASSRYLGNFGNCEHIGEIGAVGSAACSEIVTFDTSTLNDTFNNPEFTTFVESNTTLNENGKREINPNSKLADYIKYNNERITPIGVTDGGVLSALQNGGNTTKIPILSNIIDMIKTWLGSNEDDKRIASGAAFVNSSSNQDWNEYKYAQRYVSLARAADALREYDGDETAYTNLRFFEGDGNPVVAFLNQYYNTIAEE